MGRPHRPPFDGLHWRGIRNIMLQVRPNRLARVDAQIERTRLKRRIETEKRRLYEVTIRELTVAAKRATLADLLFTLYARKTDGIFKWFKCVGFSYTTGKAEDRDIIID